MSIEMPLWVKWPIKLDGFTASGVRAHLSINLIVFMLKILMIDLLRPLRNTNEKSCLKKNGPILEKKRPL